MNFFKKKYRSLKWRLIKRFGATQQYADYLYFLEFGKKINWDKPEDLNQWINWLAFNTDTSEWSRLSDKYAVRDYVMECGLNDTLVPLLAVWDAPDDIDFSILPDKFVLKMNNGSGDVRIIKDKSKADLKEIKSFFSDHFNRPFGIDSAEPHYLKIKPKIIAEQLLNPEKQSTPSSSLIDYKVWCINGEPRYIKVYLNRTKEKTEMTGFDTEWNLRDDINAYSDHFIPPKKPINRPMHLDKMLEYARILSKSFPQVRVDFYEVNGKIYFGELTFTSSCGRMTSFSDSAQKELGDMIAKKLTNNK